MKLLLDENLPKKLKQDLSEHKAFTVADKKWNGKKNGELLKLMLEDSFDVLLTFDKNLQFQQNFEKYPISVLVLNARDNSHLTLKGLVPKILKLLKSELPTGPTEIAANTEDYKTSEIKQLFNQIETLSYPNSMIKVMGDITGRAFFPGGKGTFDNDENISGKNVMILGQDFDCETNYSKTVDIGYEDGKKNPTWRNLLSFLSSINITFQDCFFTNAIMGIRKGDKGTGKSPAFKDNNFINECQNFFLFQLEMQKPKVIFVLGKETAQFLSELSENLDSWKRISTFKSVDGRNQQVILNAHFKNGISTNLVLLTHPSFRPSNVHRRSYKGLIGNEAEIKMAEVALKLPEP